MLPIFLILSLVVTAAFGCRPEDLGKLGSCNPRAKQTQEAPAPAQVFVDKLHKLFDRKQDAHYITASVQLNAVTYEVRSSSGEFLGSGEVIFSDPTHVYFKKSRLLTSAQGKGISKKIVGALFDLAPQGSELKILNDNRETQVTLDNWIKEIKESPSFPREGGDSAQYINAELSRRSKESLGKKGKSPLWVGLMNSAGWTDFTIFADPILGRNFYEIRATKK